VRVPFQAIGNRLKFLENFYDLFTGGAAGALAGVFKFASSITFDLSNGGLNLVGNDDFNINLGGVDGSPGGVQLFCNGLLGGHLFTAGRSGRANRKPLAVTATSTIDPTLYDTYVCLAVANITLTVAAGSYVAGECFRVVNTTSGFTITLKDPAASTVFTLESRSASRNSYVDIMFNGTNWREIGGNHFV